MIKLFSSRRLLAPSACALVAASLSLALVPLVASANSGSITATEDCATWSASVQLDANVTPDHLVDVVVSPTFGHAGFVGQSFDTTAAKGPTTIWGPFTGAAPVLGTITLTIHLPGGVVESSSTATLQPPTTCVKNSPAITTTLSTGSIAVPGSVHDSASLTGATATAGGTVSYAVYTDTACSLGVRSAGTKTVTNGKVPDSDALAIMTAGTYAWQATYSGDAANSRAVSACGTETLTASAAVLTQTISGHIYDCTGGIQTTTEVHTGTVGATGPTSVPATPNPMSAPVLTGDYAESATAPSSFHFVTCGGTAVVVSPTVATTNVVVPPGGTGTGIFYVASNPVTGMLSANIYDCTTGPTTTDVSGGTLGATGITGIAARPNPVGPVVVQPGDYIVTATAPPGYTLVACGKAPGNTRTVTVPPNATANATFYVTRNPVAPVPGAGSEAAGSPGTNVQATNASNAAQAAQAAQAANASRAAGATQPVTGRADIARAGLVSLLLVIGGVALVRASHMRRPVRA